MEDRDLAMEGGRRLTRRRLVLVGAAGATGAWLGGLTRLEDVARAAGAGTPPTLRRSTYTSLSSPDFTVVVEGGTAPLHLVAVEDLPAAESLPALRGHEDAFAVRFHSRDGLVFPRGTQRLSHPDLGTFELFVAPVDLPAEPRAYEAVVDRTIRMAGLDAEGVPQRVSPAARAGDAEAAAQAPSAGGTSRRAAARTRLVRASLRRGRSPRRLLAHVVLSADGDVDSVNALLLRRGRLVGADTAAPRGRRFRLRFASRSRPRPGRYTLVLIAIGADGRVTRLRRRLRLR